MSVIMHKFQLPDFRRIQPFQQGAYIIVLITIVSLACFIFGQKGLNVWTFILMPLILFCFYNPILALFQQKLLQYYIQSIITFIGLLMYAYISGNFISEISYSSNQELLVLTIVIIVFFVMLHIACIFIKGIINFLNEIDK
ncbi:MAG: hypothetical protein RJA25_2401 [Bacteroidota bacterium]